MTGSECIYCDAPGCDTTGFGPDTAVHANTCPTVTGLYPVTAADVGIPCPRCRVLFDLDDVYTHAHTDRTNIVEIVCVGCAVLLAEELS